ncbi:MAG: hypothetical protein ACYTGB_19440 [Planctomycetota bacterium]|jgi:hypothetical protein
MSGKAILVVLVLAVVMAVGIGLGIVKVMEKGDEARLARPARRTSPPRTTGTPRPGRPRAAKDLREFMKLLSRTRWLQAAGADFKTRAGAWQDAASGKTADVSALLEPAAAREVTLAYMLWDKGSLRAKSAGDRILAAGRKYSSADAVRGVYRVLSAAGHPGAAEMLPTVKALEAGGGPGTAPARPEDCKLWLELSALR